MTLGEATSTRDPANPKPASTPPHLVAVEWSALVALVGFFVARGLVPAWKQLNTDFPNYYLAAKLLVAGAPLERMYDWIWFQRQKDHAGIDWGVVAYGPLTPFSALVLAPLTSLSALAAKRCWLVLNVGLLASTIALLRGMTKLPPRRVAIVVFLTVIPLRTNFDFGQQYVLLLSLLVLAGHFYLKDRAALSGAIIAVATVLKISPAIFVVFFVLKRRWNALAAFAVSLALALAGGIASFGVTPLRVYVTSMLPRVSGGEVHDPYYLPLNSVTVLLRRLFVLEPDLNPQPLFDAPLGYVLLQPLVQSALLVSSLWILWRRRAARSEDALHWGAFAALSLVLSTGSSTYHFCGLILATVLAVDELVKAGRVRHALVLVALHALVSAPLYRFVPSAPSGAAVFLGVPRLYALLAYWFTLLYGITRLSSVSRASRPEVVIGWLFFAGLTLSGVLANERHFAGVAPGYAARIGAGRGSLLGTTPAASRAGVYFTRMDDEGYSLVDAADVSPAGAARGEDLFHPAIATDADQGWVEVSSRASGVAPFPLHHAPIVAADLPIAFFDAERPAVSPDGHWLAFVRDEGGRGRLWIADVGNPARPGAARRIAPSSFDVVDASVSSGGDVVFAANREGESHLFLTHASGGDATSLDTLGTSPSFSPDGRWLAYSHPVDGAWQIEAMELVSRTRRRVTRGDCNSLTPAWTPDGRSLVYASDCGRGLGATALYEAALSP